MADPIMMFCHECRHEFERGEHGLECPECHSDFVEEVSCPCLWPRLSTSPALSPCACSARSTTYLVHRLNPIMTLETQTARNLMTDRKSQTAYLSFLCHIAAFGILMIRLIRMKVTLNTLSGTLVPILPFPGLRIGLPRLDFDPLTLG